MISTTVYLQYLFLACINKTIPIPGCGGGDVTSLVTGRRLCPAARLIVSTTTESGVAVELQTKVPGDFTIDTITEKAPTKAFSWFKAATSAFTFKTLLRHYTITKQMLTPQ